jgi:hypothetical protein
LDLPITSLDYNDLTPEALCALRNHLVVCRPFQRGPVHH